jgi:hypothetical protein
MDRRRALATFASVTLGAAAITAAVGATTQVFNVAEASPGVGRVSPVSTPTLPPVIEHRVVDIEDPVPPAAPVPTSPAPAGGHERTSRPARAGTSPTPTPSTTPATVPTERHESESDGEDD